MISAVSSGSGKTLVTCGLLKALKTRGLVTGAGKCGPDYIDPMFHREVLETFSANYDCFFEDGDLMRSLFLMNSEDKDITIIEGVMGYYDGISFENPEKSTYECAVNLKCPVILVVNARGMSYTLAGVIKGILGVRSDNNIRGLILNNIRKETYERFKNVLERETGLRLLGFFPHNDSFNIESRHLGLMTPDEVGGLKEKIELLGKTAEKCLDIDGIIKIAEEAEELSDSSVDLITEPDSFTSGK